MNKATTISVNPLEMALILDVGGEEYKLDANFSGSQFTLLYSVSLEDAVGLGSTKDALIALGDSLFGKGEGEKLYKKIQDFISGMPSLFSKIFTGFLNADLVITKIQLIIESGKPTQYALGLGLLFYKEEISIAGVKLEYFTFDYNGTSDPKDPQPVLHSQKTPLRRVK